MNGKQFAVGLFLFVLMYGINFVFWQLQNDVFNQFLFGLIIVGLWTVFVVLDIRFDFFKNDKDNDTKGED